MCNIYELGIIGMGPAGIGMAMSLRGTDRLKKTVCFEKGNYIDNVKCPALMQKECCKSNVCDVISGVGGASNLNSGKISDFPAGSGLVEFFDSEQELRELCREIISVLMKNIALKKVEIEAEVKRSAELFYGQKNIKYKYYDVYEFDGRDYRNIIHKNVQQLTNEGLQLFENTEVVSVDHDAKKSCFRVTTKTPDGERKFCVRNLVIATGALDIQDRLLTEITGLDNSCYEIGVRIEAPSRLFGNVLSSHGDMKLKFDQGRTYCVTTNGKIISYQTERLHFLEGCIDSSVLTGYTNMAVLIKCDNSRNILDFIQRYNEQFMGIPIKQRYVDYVNCQASEGKLNTTLSSAINGDINNLFPKDINVAIKNFIETVVVNAMKIPVEYITLVAPELKILRNLPLKKNFELYDNLFVIGAATGKFRGILQTFSSGIRCGQLIIGR